MARGKSNHTMFKKLWETWKKIQARGDILYFSPSNLIVTLKRAQKSNWGKIYDFFSPLGLAIIILLLQTVYWGENMTRGKSNHIFRAGHNLFL